MCSYTPRFSYEVSKTVIWACPRSTTDACTTGYSTGMGRGMAPGTGIRVGAGEGYTGTQPATAKRSMIQRSGPRKPLQGAGVGGIMHSAHWASGDHPSGPVGTLRAPPCHLLEKPRLLAYRARLMTYSYKVSQNDEVSTKSVYKACHSPYIPKRVPDVASWISQISISPSLLSQGINGRYLTIPWTLLSKRRSVARVYTHGCHAKGCSDTPTVTAASCLR